VAVVAERAATIAKVGLEVMPAVTEEITVHTPYMRPLGALPGRARAVMAVTQVLVE
jgi:hypothetical protein